MEVRINKEVRNYQESLFFGLSLRQFLFALLAVAVAVGVYFGLRPVLENGEIGISHPQTACFQIGKYVRKTDGTLICEGGVES